jgi:hypothetical protein
MHALFGSGTHALLGHEHRVAVVLPARLPGPVNSKQVASTSHMGDHAVHMGVRQMTSLDPPSTREGRNLVQQGHVQRTRPGAMQAATAGGGALPAPVQVHSSVRAEQSIGRPGPCGRGQCCSAQCRKPLGRWAQHRPPPRCRLPLQRAAQCSPHPAAASTVCARAQRSYGCGQSHGSQSTGSAPAAHR